VADANRRRSQLIDRSQRERIVLVGVAVPPRTVEDAEAGLDELSALVDTAGATESARVIQKRDEPDTTFYVGKGKAQELREVSETVDADTVVFDTELSPAQSRNLEKLLGRTAIDRTAVILDIFAQNARSAAGKAQVELAQLRYWLPRLKGKGDALSQQAGAAGGGLGARRGPGETKLEVDRRRVRERIARLEQQLRDHDKVRKVQRKGRRRNRQAAVTLVGYTNAGKSTLLNQLTQAGVLVETRLFSTLDPTTRRLDLPGGEVVLLSDTVGFVRDLPHTLVEAFKSTLDEVAESDLLVHVVDASAPDPEGNITAVHTVLAEIGADAVPQILVFNKADVAWPERVQWLLDRYRPSVAVSAVTGAGIEGFLELLGEQVRALTVVTELLVPYERGDVLAALHREGEVLVEVHEERGTRIQARLDEAARGRWSQFVVEPAGT
jgi:GTP-binding protein HflX